MNAEIILDKFRQIPVLRGIEALQRILFGVRWYAEQGVSQAIAPIAGGEIGGVASTENEETTRRGNLVKVSLLATKINAELSRMPAMHPGDSVGYLENILDGHFRGEFGIAE